MAKRSLSSEEHLHGTMAKRKRSGLQLSNLPTDILCHILSKLPLKEAVRTCLLSKQWRYRWCRRPSLEFTMKSILSSRHLGGPITDDTENLNKQEFIERVDAVLRQHSGLGVENLTVWFPFHHENTDHLERWVNFAIASKTEHLTLDFSSACSTGEPRVFHLRPLDGSASSHLQHVELSFLSLKLPADFKGFQNLKGLHLAHTDITDEDLRLLMSNCNVLGFLGITDCGMLTRIHISNPSNHLKHLKVHNCRSLQVLELNFGLLTLDYSGPSMQLSPPGSLLLTKISTKLCDCRPSLDYIFTELPSTVPCLEVLTLKSYDLKRATLPENLPKFVHLRHLRLELTFAGGQKKTDTLDFVCLLVAAPSLEKLEFHMWMACEHQRYNYHQGELRSLPLQPHSHLRFVDITGFYGQKDQLELVLHILRNAVMLEAMKIDPKPSVAANYGSLVPREALYFLDGYEVACEYVYREDRRRVVRVTNVRRADVENTPAKFLVDPFWIKFLAEKKAKRTSI